MVLRNPACWLRLISRLRIYFQLLLGEESNSKDYAEDSTSKTRVDQMLELSQVYQGAVTLTRELDVRCLWTDSICIIQDSLQQRVDV